MKKPSLADLAMGHKKLTTSAFSRDFENPRIEAFVCLFNRCFEWHLLCSHECLYNPSLFTLNCAQIIRQRLGVLRTFDVQYCCRPWRLTLAMPEASDAMLPPGGPGHEDPLLHTGSISASSHSLASTSKSLGTLATTKGAAKANRFAQLAVLRKSIEAGRDPEEVSFELEPGRRYTFDLGVYEEWSCVFLLCCLNTKEEGESLARCSWSERARMQEQGYDFIPPPAWAVDGPDKTGSFQCTYMSEADDYINMKARCSLAERFCGWETS